MIVVVEIAVASVVGVYYLEHDSCVSEKIIISSSLPEPPKKLLKALVSPERKPF